MASAAADGHTARTWPSDRVRQVFMDFFRERGHVFVPSSPVVPHEDPTLLFTNAGMNQFKPQFLGRVDPRSPLYSVKRAYNSQKCIRAGGKHNDLDDVGRDTYHHTFFEMLGNWSFGDYFKAEAIAWAWQLLTEVYGIPGERLYATYFGGDDALQLPADEETRALWLRHLPPGRVLPFGVKDNFWEMGETGPCGPCTEIHYDRVDGRDSAAGAPLVNAGDPSLMEVWNVVLIQYNREPDGSLRRLPARHVDTGMGFERLCSVLQGTDSNYDTDVFAPLFAAIQCETGCSAPYGGRVGRDDAEGVDMAYRVVADHIRTLSFAIADGAVPSNEGRGYVLRRILRRAVRYGQQFLQAPQGFFHRLVPVLVQRLQHVFPELAAKQDMIMTVLADEESSFGLTLKRGLERFRVTANALQAAGQTVLPGHEAFFLYDSMGFPLDLTQILAEERGMTVDAAGYQEEMARQKAQSAAAHRAKMGNAGQLVLGAEQLAALGQRGVPLTDDSSKYVWYENPDAKVCAVYTVEHGWVERVGGDGEALAGVVLDRTPFYAESGGQVADRGRLGDHFRVLQVQAYGGYVLHIGTGSLAVGDVISAQVDYDYRALVAPNHTATHLLNWALRQVLGDVCDQRGSLVDEQKLRFDFSFTRALTTEEVQRVEAECRRLVERDLPVYTAVTSLQQARSVRGLRAVFGETYPDPVRVVSVGVPVEHLLERPQDESWMQYSVELCGGTHLRRTGEARAFCLVEEGAIAKGIRRVAALTGRSAAESIIAARALSCRVLSAMDGPAGDGLSALTEALNAASISAAEKDALRQRLAQLEKERKRQSKALATEREKAWKEAVRQQCADIGSGGGDQRYVVLRVDTEGDKRAMQNLLREAVRRCPTAAQVMLISADAANDAVDVVVMAGEASPPNGNADARRQDTLTSEQWLQATLRAWSGRGGGRERLARGSVSDASQAERVVERARKVAQGEA
ncbi:hypothetical protein CDCA_CDCA07G2059 [Cyanidium caldarium]|uniref:Alanine--tRNA ligase n=1 Tax=Cyanidium caldarium TaxID=2771 RepID=A0AAV9IUU0_CYACA|nr:hypothetical protein CDCA_CDCA07G2059 [Cyanidium caldarium]